MKEYLKYTKNPEEVPNEKEFLPDFSMYRARASLYHLIDDFATARFSFRLIRFL